MLGYGELAGVLSGFSGSSFRRYLSFTNGQDARSPSYGLCEVLASTNHPIRFGPVSTFATSTFA